MRLNGIGLASIVLILGCADKSLDHAETSVTSEQTITFTSNLDSQSEFAASMSKAYLQAARQTIDAQDVAAFGVFLAAATAVSGAVGTASNLQVAHAGLFGVGTQSVANRTVPKTVIQAIYTGSKRLNCIATIAKVGTKLLVDQPAIDAGRALTFGAINEVMITTREGMIRDVQDYKALVTAATDVTKPTGNTQIEGFTQGGDRNAQQPLDIDKIKVYTELLANCLADGPLQTSETAVSTAGK